ncbi:hypothetical protein [Desulfomicrobium baculatum]|uniref:hypothetical protein n=1 Tax=Desulfomicrobium baculatum TaxID=899 RepID=UPI00019E207E|nr:hypothetical protein [Desulfomicrobium baculatum]
MIVSGVEVYRRAYRYNVGGRASSIDEGRKGLLPKKASGLHAAWTIASAYALDHPLMMPLSAMNPDGRKRLRLKDEETFWLLVLAF